MQRNLPYSIIVCYCIPATCSPRPRLLEGLRGSRNEILITEPTENKRTRWLANGLAQAYLHRTVTCAPNTCTQDSYVAAKATYIRLFHGKIGILEGFFGPSSVHRGRTHIVLG